MNNSITVSSSGTNGKVNVTPDTAQYWSQKSREYATSPNLVDNEDYSSKYYAKKSKEASDIATNAIGDIEASKTEFDNTYNEYTQNLTTQETQAIQNITTKETDSISNLASTAQTEIGKINSAGSTQITNIENTANTGKAEIATATQSGKNEMQNIYEQFQEQVDSGALVFNNPFFFGLSQYFEKAPNNLSWLKSSGQWNLKAVYADYYNWILENVNNSVDGFKLSDTDYTDYDFVINTENETFRLPLLNGSEDLPTTPINKALPTINGQEFTAEFNGIAHIVATTNNVTQHIAIKNKSTGDYVETRPSPSGVASTVSIWVNRGDKYTISADVISTISSHILIKAKGNGSLYYYVGATVQNAPLINAGALSEGLALKVDKAQAAHASSPSHNCQKLTIGANGTPYTAPTDGRFQIIALSNGWVSNNFGNPVYAGLLLYLSNNGEKYDTSQRVAACDCSTYASVDLEVKKGDTVKYLLSGVYTNPVRNYTNLGLYFIPNEGSEVV